MSDTTFRIPDFSRAVAWLRRDYNYLKVFLGVAFVATCAAVSHSPRMLGPFLMMLPMFVLGVMNIRLGNKLKGCDEDGEQP